MTPEQSRFLAEQRVARLATVDERGHPHAVPICFALLDGLIYTPIDEKPKRDPTGPLRRLRNIESNPHVCLVADVYDEDWTRLAWLQVRGTAALVDDPDERSRALAALRAKYAQYRAMDLEARPLVRIEVARVVEWRATEYPHPRPLPRARERGA